MAGRFPRGSRKYLGLSQLSDSFYQNRFRCDYFTKFLFLPDPSTIILTGGLEDVMFLGKGWFKSAESKCLWVVYLWMKPRLSSIRFFRFPCYSLSLVIKYSVEQRAINKVRSPFKNKKFGELNLNPGTIFSPPC